jgi:P pilus assembly chaperone PapD
MPIAASHNILRQTLAIAAFLLVGATAQAQITIDRTELVLRPDSAAQRNGVMLVRNTGRSQTTATILIEDWDRGADGAHRFYDAGTQPGSCASVLAISPREFTLSPGESRTVQIGVDGAVNSACWSLVLVETAERVRDERGKVVLAAVRTGMKVYAEPSDSRALGEVSEVELETSESAHSGTVTGASVLAAVTFRNTGERHLRGEGRIEIRGVDDCVLTTLPLPDVQTLPGAEMTARVALPATLKGTYRLRAVVNYGGSSVAAAEREAAFP